MRSRFALVFLAIVAAASAVCAAEQTIQMKDLPPAVRDAVQRETKDTTVEGLAKERGGRKSEVAVDADGKPVER
jgi:sulfur carrier protein ThiS